ncbi:MAG: MarR family winged helix-turn-helix transcriptional regulator [Gammaproteobacteria bacterium]|nr:MarR family winged helix-turn-helix transcriptional regulator [Gammaproteobacteria bacterium]
MAARSIVLEQTDLSDLSEHTGYHIRRAHTYFTRVFSVYGKRFNLRSQQATILALTDKNPGIAPTCIADANDIKRSLVAKLVSDLETRGLITTRSSKTDRRRKGLHITAKGRAFLRRVMETFATELDPLLTRNLTNGEKTTLIKLLTKIYQD